MHWCTVCINRTLPFLDASFFGSFTTTLDYLSPEGIIECSSRPRPEFHESNVHNMSMYGTILSVPDDQLGHHAVRVFASDAMQ
jgi:hypothetical protein